MVVVVADVSTTFGAADFHHALGLQVSLWARDGAHAAELRLNPADMGPVSVQITVQGDQAQVSFGADVARTRELIEAGWASLAAAMQEAGFTLTGGGVSEHAAGRHAGGQTGSQPTHRAAVHAADHVADGAVDGAVDGDAPTAARWRPVAGAVVDLYA